MSNTLLPCPFCGGNEHQIDEMESFWDKNETSWRVLCIDCIVETAGDTKEQAIAAWNRRSDAVPVVRGEWIQKHHIISLNNMTLTGTYPTCNLCDYAEVGMAKKSNYCPNCGAKMEGEKK